MRRKRREFAHALADATAEHDKDVAGRHKVYKDQLTFRQATRDDAVDAALWGYERLVADEAKGLAVRQAGIVFNLASGGITSADAATQQAAATACCNLMVGAYGRPQVEHCRGQGNPGERERPARSLPASRSSRGPGCGRTAQLCPGGIKWTDKDGPGHGPLF